MVRLLRVLRVCPGADVRRFLAQSYRLRPVDHHPHARRDESPVSHRSLVGCPAARHVLPLHYPRHPRRPLRLRPTLPAIHPCSPDGPPRTAEARATRRHRRAVARRRHHWPDRLFPTPRRVSHRPQSDVPASSSGSSDWRGAPLAREHARPLCPRQSPPVPRGVRDVSPSASDVVLLASFLFFDRVRPSVTKAFETSWTDPPTAVPGRPSPSSPSGRAASSGRASFTPP